MDTAKTYCLFCISGQESKIIEKLKRAGYEPLAPKVMHRKPDKGKKGSRQAVRRLLPGYVFFDADSEPGWQDIRSYPSVLRILQYDDGERAMHGSDMEFVAWLKRYNGVIEISHVIQVGTKIEFVDGPLKYLDGHIIKVNKNRKQVQIALGNEEGLLHTMWCPIEYIEATADLSKLGDA